MEEKEEDLQRRLSIESFYSIFPNEEACLRMFPTVCNDCGPTVPVESVVERSFTCSICQKLCWRTAGTFFHGMRLVLPGFLLIWLIEDQIKISINAFSRAAGIVYSSAWGLTNRVSNLCLDEMLQSKDLFGVETDLFNKVIFRRSKLTPASQHPRQEEAVDEPTPVENPIFESEQENMLFSALSDEPTHVEVVAEKAGVNSLLASLLLTRMEMTNAVTRLSGDLFVVKRVRSIESSRLTEDQICLVAKFFEFVKWSGTSRKYLQVHIARFWATITTKVKWRATSLFNTCMDFSKLGRTERPKYVSPSIISMAAA